MTVSTHSETLQLKPRAHQAVSCMIIRGGTSKGLYFHKDDLPGDKTTRDELLIRIMGSPDPKQIDGLGGATPVTSKIAIVSRSQRVGVDIDYEFAQVLVGRPEIDFPTCGNILSGVGIFALETGLIKPSAPETILTIYDVNIGAHVKQTIQTPEHKLSWHGSKEISGVPGTAAPIVMELSNIVGGKTGKMHPSGNKIDVIDGVRMSLIDVAMPCMYVLASDVGLSGTESKHDLDANKPLLEKLLSLRIKAGERMGIINVAKKVYPKIALVSEEITAAGMIRSRYFTPYVCHDAYAASGAFSLAAACIDTGTIPSEIFTQATDNPFKVTIAHPSGTMPVELSIKDNDITKLSVKVVRTARPLMLGAAYLP
ncbi:4-oxalomesaconate tautomerase [Spirochaetota bacterium]|nr:4-oxalomesaconate tautomerase [Spirochaetota bacterium]